MLRAAVACWIVYPIVHVGVDVSQRFALGAGGYNRDAWHHADVVAWIRAHALRPPVVSNDPDALYLLTGVEARPIAPHRAPARTAVLFTRASPAPEPPAGTALFAGHDGTVVALE
jgi:hypothetical protein